MTSRRRPGFLASLIPGAAYVALDAATDRALSRFLAENVTPIALGAAVGFLAAFLAAVYDERAER